MEKRKLPELFSRSLIRIIRLRTSERTNVPFAMILLLEKSGSSCVKCFKIRLISVSMNYHKGLGCFHSGGEEEAKVIKLFFFFFFSLPSSFTADEENEVFVWKNYCPTFHSIEQLFNKFVTPNRISLE